MSRAASIALIVPIVFICVVASALLIWDMWHIPVIYVDDGVA